MPFCLDIALKTKFLKRLAKAALWSTCFSCAVTYNLISTPNARGMIIETIICSCFQPVGAEIGTFEFSSSNSMHYIVDSSKLQNLYI